MQIIDWKINNTIDCYYEVAKGLQFEGTINSSKKIVVDSKLKEHNTFKFEKYIKN